MALIQRLKQGSEASPKISPHQFYAALMEMRAGELTQADLVTLFSLTPEDQADLTWLIGRYNASANQQQFVERLHGIFMLSEGGFAGYDTEAEVAGVIERMG